MKKVFGAVAAVWLFAFPAFAQNLVTDNSYLTVRSAAGNWWWSMPDGGGELSAQDESNASLLFIKKVRVPGGNQDNIIRSGDYVRIRTTDHDPWLAADTKVSTTRVNGNPVWGEVSTPE